MNSIFKSFMLVVFSVVLLENCASKDETELTISYKLQYNGQPLAAFEEIEYPRGYKAFFTKYSFYLSEIQLLNDTKSVTLTDVEFVDLLTNMTKQQAAIGTLRTYSNLPYDTYTSLRFNIGLPVNVNATNPSSYPVGTPLANTGEYWEGWSSYIVHKIEGKVDDDNSGAFKTGVALHLGSDVTLTPVTIDANIVLNKESQEISIVFDLFEILNVDDSYFNFVETPQVHHLGVLPRVLPLLGSTAEHVRVEM